MYNYIDDKFDSKHIQWLPNQATFTKSELLLEEIEASEIGTAWYVYDYLACFENHNLKSDESADILSLNDATQYTWKTKNALL